MTNKQKPHPPKGKNNSGRSKAVKIQARQAERHTQDVVAISPKTLVRSILPDKYHCILKYTSSKTYTSSTGGIVGSTNTFRLNGLHDPDITGTGHQPYGYDQITPFYSSYTVKSCKINIIVTGVDDSSNYLAWMVQPQGSTTTLAGLSIETISEYDETNYLVLGQSSSGIPNQQVRLPTLNLPKLEGLSWQAYFGNSNYRASVGSNPSQGTSFVVGIGNAAGTTGKNATLTIEFLFDAYFEGRKSLPQS